MMNIHYAPSPTVTTKNGITSKFFFHSSLLLLVLDPGSEMRVPG
jgi:hypothetical protein